MELPCAVHMPMKSNPRPGGPASNHSQDECEAELAVALPLLENALAALNTLTKADITEVRRSSRQCCRCCGFTLQVTTCPHHRHIILLPCHPWPPCRSGR